MASVFPTKTAHLWTQELVFAFLSLVCCIVMFVLLLLTNGHTWKSYVSLNAILAIMSTAQCSLAVAAVSPAMSQLTWIWYHVKKPLHDLFLLEQASRGPRGALKLVRERKGPKCAQFGAILILLLPIIHPCTQQIITNSFRTVIAVNGVAEVARATYYNDTSPGTIRLVNNPSDSMLIAIPNGINNDNPDLFAVKPVCATGNCEFPPVSTLAIYAKCRDVPASELTTCSADDLNSTCVVAVAHGGPALSSPDTQLNLTTSIINSQATNNTKRLFPDIPQQLLSFSVISRNDSLVVASQCILALSVNSYHSRVVNNISSELLLRSWTNSTPIGPGQPDWIMRPDLDGQTFRTTWVAMSALQRYLADYFQGTISSTKEGLIYSGDTTALKRMATFARTGSFQIHMEIFAKVLTDELRASQSRNGEIRTSNNTVLGKATQEQEYVRVRWIWFLPSACLSPLVMVFLWGTICLTAKHSIPSLKSSVIALLMAGLWPANTARIFRDSTLEEVEADSRLIRIHLREHETGLHFSAMDEEEIGIAK